MAASRCAQKKSPYAAERDRPDVAEARRAFLCRQPALDPDHLVLIDETWAAANIARRYGRAARGLRLLTPVPHGHWNVTTPVAGLRCRGITAPCVLDRASTNRESAETSSKTPDMQSDWKPL
jgi:hypothetical protein